MAKKKLRTPFKSDLMWKANEAWEPKDMWWPISSHPDDNMVIGDQIPGDKQTADLCARCCNIAYRQALEDIFEILKDKGICEPERFLGITNELNRF